MRVALVLVVILMMAGAAQGSESGDGATTFDWPAELGPALDVRGASWALILMPSDHNVSLNASFPGGASVTEYTKHLYAEVHGPIAGSTGTPVEGGEQTKDLGPMETHMGPSRTWSSLFIAGPSLQLNMTGLDGRVLLKRDGECLRRIPVELDERYLQLARFNDLCPIGAHVVIAVRSDHDLTHGAEQFTLMADRAERVEWHGANITCTTTDCPSGGPRTRQSTALPTGHTITNTDNTYVSLTAHQGASLNGRGEAAVVFIGGASLDVGVDGRARFPASGLEGCSACEPSIGQTLQVTGAIELGDLHPEGDHRMRTQLVGEAASVRLDEVAINPTSLGLKVAGGTVAAAAVVATALVLLKVFFGSLFTRHTQKGALEHERRRRLYDYIVEHPGIHLRQALRAADVPSGSGRHHITKLAQAGLIVERRRYNTVCLFPTDARFADSWKEWAALHNPEYRLLYEWVQAHPDKSQNEIVAAFAVSHDWRRGVTRKRVERLAAEGIVHFRHQGRFKFYAASKANAAVAASLSASPAAVP
jgi:hypothetical protein